MATVAALASKTTAALVKSAPPPSRLCATSSTPAVPFTVSR